MTSARKPSRTFLLPLLAILGVAALYPVKTITSPEWTIVFVDKKSRPFSNLPVRQVWKNYSAETASHEETQVTNSNGSVTFPERYAHSPLLMRLLKPIGNVASTGVHASFGPSSYLIQLCDLLETGDITATMTDGKVPARATLSYFDRTPIRAATGGAAQPGCSAIEAQARDADA